MEHVVQLLAQRRLPTDDLADLLLDARVATTDGVSIRDAEADEALALAETLGALRDALGISDIVRYHECRHDEGIGDCTGAAVEI